MIDWAGSLADQPRHPSCSPELDGLGMLPEGYLLLDTCSKPCLSSTGWSATWVQGSAMLQADMRLHCFRVKAS